MKRLGKVLSELPRATLELLCTDFMSSLLVWQDKLTHEDQMLELLDQRLGKQKRDELLEKALEGEDGLKKVGEAASSFVYEYLKHGGVDPEINAIREGVKKAIREGAKGAIDEQVDVSEEQMEKVSSCVEAHLQQKRDLVETKREAGRCIKDRMAKEQADAAARQRLKEDEIKELTMAERLKKLDVMCKHTGQVFDVEFAAKHQVRWSCPCGHRYELQDYVVDRLTNHSTDEPSVIFIDEDCRRKEWP